MIYEFKCNDVNCGHVQTVMCLMDELKIQHPRCEKCNSSMYRRFTPISFKISNVPHDFGKGMNADKEQQQILERTGGWD